MNNFFKLTHSERKTVILQTGIKMNNLFPQVIEKDFAIKAIVDDELWNTIHHHREVFTRMNGVDYTPDIRCRICLIPPLQVIDDWRQDYKKMQGTMIYGDSLPFDKLLARIEELQKRFRKVE